MKDVNANTYSKKIDLTTTIWEQIKVFFEKAWEIAAKLVDMFLDWLIEQVLKIFGVWDAIVGAVSRYVGGIETSMTSFFTELGKFEEMDGDENVDLTMERGFSFTLSFLGLQSSAKSLFDIFKSIMDFLQPFMSIIDPFWLIEQLTNFIGGVIPSIGEFFNTVRNSVQGAVEVVISTLINLIFGKSNSLLSLLGLGDETLEIGDFPFPSFRAMKNFLDASGIPDPGGIIYTILNSLESIWGELHHSEVEIGLIVSIVVTSFAIAFSVISPFIRGVSIGTAVDAILGIVFETIGFVFTIFTIYMEPFAPLLYNYLISVMGMGLSSAIFITNIPSLAFLIAENFYVGLEAWIIALLEFFIGWASVASSSP